MLVARTSAAAARYKFVEVGLDVYNVLDAAWFDGEFVYASRFSQGAAEDLIPVRHVTAGRHGAS